MPTDVPRTRGYSHGKPAEAVANAFRAEKIRQALSVPLVQSVIFKGETVGTVAVRKLAPEQVGDAEVESQLLPGVLKGLEGSGYTVRTRTVSGTPVLVAYDKNSTIATWYDKGFLIQFVTSGSESVALAYVKAELAS